MDRLPDGKFAKNNQVGKLGGGISRQKRTFNQLFHEILTEEDFVIILNKIIKSAKGRNLKAQMFILKMALPRLVEVTNIEPPVRPPSPEEQRQDLIDTFGVNYHQRMREFWSDKGIEVN